MSARRLPPWLARILGSDVRPTAAILTAEECAERWCCPCCGGLNSATHEIAAQGWCQHEPCVEARQLARGRGVPVRPEITLCLTMPHAEVFA